MSERQLLIDNIERLIKEAPVYGYVQFRAIFHDGKICRIITTHEESIQVSQKDWGDGYVR